MGDEKSGIGNTSRERDRELLIPVADSADDDSSWKPSSSASSLHHHSGRELKTSSSCKECFERTVKFRWTHVRGYVVPVRQEGCQAEIPPFSGRLGLYIEGSVSPPLCRSDQSNWSRRRPQCCNFVTSGGNADGKQSEQVEGDDNLRTVECLRGRLLAERAASRNAKEEADQLGNKLIELETRLKEETKSRNRAEKRLKALMKKLESLKIFYVSCELELSGFLEKAEISSASSVASTSTKEAEDLKQVNAILNVTPQNIQELPVEDPPPFFLLGIQNQKMLRNLVHPPLKVVATLLMKGW